MASQGATLQAYVNELVKTIEDMKDKQENLRNQILEEEDEKNRVERELSVLADRLEKINEILVRQANEKKQLEATVIETEEAKTKLAENFKTLLSYLQQQQFAKGKRVHGDI